MAQFYKIFLPFRKDFDIEFHPIYLSSEKIFPYRQIKYFKMKRAEIAIPEISVEGLLEHASLTDSTLEEKMLPNLSFMTPAEISACESFYDSDPNSEDYFYSKGKIAEHNGNFKEAMEFFLKGAEAKNALCLFHMARIFVEKKFVEEYEVEPSTQKSFAFLTDSIIHNGLVQYETGDNSLILLHLFMIYCDTLQGFGKLSEARIQKLIQDLTLDSMETIISVSELREELEFSVPKTFNLILGDLFHPEIIGISSDVDFNQRQSYYSYYVKENLRDGWLKVFSLNKRLLEHFMVDKSTAITNEPIAKIRKNIYFSIEKIKDIGKYNLRSEILHHLAVKADVIYPLEADSEIPNSYKYLQTLVKLGNRSSMKHLYLVFRTLKKAISDDPLEFHSLAKSLIDNTEESMYWRTEALAFCYQKGIHVEANPKVSATLRNYSMMNSQRFLAVQSYKYFKWLEKEEEVKEYTKIFQEFCLYGISCGLENESEAYISAFVLAKLYKRGILVEEDNEKSLLILHYIAKTLESEHPESISSKCFLYKTKTLLKKAGVTTLKPLPSSFSAFIAEENHIIKDLLKDFLVFESVSRGNIENFLTECLHNTIKLSEKLETLKNIGASSLISELKEGKIMPKELQFVAFANLVESLKSKLAPLCHIFEDGEYEILDEFYNEIYNGVILRNKQKVKAFTMSLNKKQCEQLYENLKIRAKFSSPFVLSIMGVNCKFKEESVSFTIFFEDFTEFLVDMIERNGKMEKRYEIALKTLYTMRSSLNSQFYALAFDSNSFVITFKGQIKVFDPSILLFSCSRKREVSEETKEEIERMTRKESIAPEVLANGCKVINTQATFLYSLGKLLNRIVPEAEVNLQDFISRLTRADIQSRLQVRVQDLQSVMEKYLMSIGIKPVFPTPTTSFFVTPLFSVSVMEEIVFLPHKSHFTGVVSSERGLPIGMGKLYQGEEIIFEGEFSHGVPSGNGKLQFKGFNPMFFEGSFLESWPLHGVYVRQAHTYIEFSKGFPKKEFFQKLLWTKPIKDLDSSFSLLEEDKELESKMERIKLYLESAKPKMLGIISCDLENRHLCAKDKQLSEFIITKVWPPNEQFIAVHVSDISVNEIFVISPFYISLLLIEKRHSKILLLQNMSSFLSQNFKGKLFYYTTERIDGTFSMLNPMRGLILKSNESYASFHNQEIYHEGIKLREDGTLYRGSIKDGMAEGYGEEKSPNSDYIYKGFFLNDKRDGEGILRSKNGEHTFRGYFCDGKPKYGTMLLPDKELEGTFRYEEKLNLDVWTDGKVRGWLHLRGERGFSCKGEFDITINEKKLTGEYKVIDRYTNNEYCGFLENGVRKGRGFYNLGNILIHGIWNDREIEGIVFWGEETSLKSSLGLFKINEKGELLMEEFGALVFKKGNRYEGELVKNKLHGVGENKFLDGRYYFGEFDNGIRDGFGSLFDQKSHMTYTGFFTNGSLSGFGRIYKNDKLVAEGLFQDDTLLIGSIFYDHELITHIEASSFLWNESEKTYIPRGHGKIVMRNENVIECSLENIRDVISGKEENILNCTLLNSKEKSFYEGSLLNFKPNGLGRMWVEGNIIYEGEFKSSLILGFGSIYKPDGRILTGAIEHMQISAFGEQENQWGEVTTWGKWSKGVLQGFALERMITETGRKFLLSKYVNQVAKAIIVLAEDEELSNL